MGELIRKWGLAFVTAVLALIVVYGLVAGAVHAPDRARSLASRLRCPVCQAESVADSPSQTAQEMNALIAQQVREGRSDKEILAFFRQRYGNWILLDPPARGATLWLWVLPGAALVVGAMVVVSRRGRGRVDEEATGSLSTEDRARVEAEMRKPLLADEY